MSSVMPESVIEVANVSRYFGRKAALRDVSFRVPKGLVFGLVGENGAGKTTLIHHLLGAYGAQTGSVRVFGLDPTQHPAEVLSRVGYLSEDRDMPGWMRVNELLRYTQAFYPTWDEIYADSMRDEFGLSPTARVKHLSRGEKAKLGLLLALAYRPELLLLDEPSSGLDAVARRDILAAVVRSVAEEGRTVLFSSHLLDEVERVADHVVMIHQGAVTLDMSMDELKTAHRSYVVRWKTPPTQPNALPGVIRREGDTREWSLLCAGDEAKFHEAVRRAGGEVVESSVPTLETIFVSRVTA
ncbi:MAG: ABC transporter ATP-binding protein [FCB group bacterium]|nr:ABC transporter ATP-binding protein [FCB group bacterium]